MLLKILTGCRNGAGFFCFHIFLIITFVKNPCFRFRFLVSLACQSEEMVLNESTGDRRAMAIDGYLDYIQFERRFSEHTLHAYRNDLVQLTVYLKEVYDVDDLSVCEYDQLRSWVVSMVEAGSHPRTINRRMVAVRSFYRWCLREGIVSVSPAAALTQLRAGSRLPEFVDEASMNRLLEEAFTEGGYHALRNRTIMELLYQTGMRVSELTGLRRGQIHPGSDALKVLGKRSRERLIPMGRQLRTVLGEYLGERDELYGTDPDAPLFFSDRHKPLYPRIVYQIVNRSLMSVTTLSKRSPHVIRHTFATAMLNRGADINAVKELLGHSSLSSTQVYTHNTIEKLRKAYQQAHPRA